MNSDDSFPTEINLPKRMKTETTSTQTGTSRPGNTKSSTTKIAWAGAVRFNDAAKYSASRTSHHVDFFCRAPEAGQVSLVGDFNGWDVAATPMKRMPDGRWMASVELHHGHHQYLFLVDGAPQLDPNACGIARNEDAFR